MKECLSCHAKIEDLLHTCPNCGGSSFAMYGGQEVADAILKQLKAKEHNDRGGQLMMQGNYIEAEKEFRQAIESNPLNAAAHSNVGLSLYRQGRIEEAIPWLEKALSINPHHEGAREALVKWKAESKAISKISCEKCGYRLPKFRVPQSSRQAMWGGWTCPNCGAELDRKGRVIGKGASQPAAQDSQSSKTSIKKQKKAGCWVWAVLILGSLLVIWGFCIGSIVVYGQISGTSSTDQPIGDYFIGLSCIVLLPLLVGLGMLGIGIYMLFRKRKQSRNIQPVRTEESQEEVRTAESSSSVQSQLASVQIPDPSNEEEYVRRCLEAEFEEEQETRTFQTDPAFGTVLTPLNNQQYLQAIKAGQAILHRFPDFDLIYKWMGSAYRRTQQLPKSRDILSEGIKKAKRKSLLLTDMGETEWQSGNIIEAIYWWSQALHCLSSNPADYNTYLLLSYVAKEIGLTDFARVLLARVDSLKSGQVRLDPTTAERLSTLVRSHKTEVMRKTLQGLQAKYF